jgi:hypothetical protein
MSSYRAMCIVYSLCSSWSLATWGVSFATTSNYVTNKTHRQKKAKSQDKKLENSSSYCCKRVAVLFLACAAKSSVQLDPAPETPANDLQEFRPSTQLSDDNFHVCMYFRAVSSSLQRERLRHS